MEAIFIFKHQTTGNIKQKLPKMHIFLEEIFLKTLAQSEVDLNLAHDSVAAFKKNKEMPDGSQLFDALKIYAISFANLLHGFLFLV